MKVEVGFASRAARPGPPHRSRDHGSGSSEPPGWGSAGPRGQRPPAGRGHARSPAAGAPHSLGPAGDGVPETLTAAQNPPARNLQGCSVREGGHPPPSPSGSRRRPSSSGASAARAPRPAGTARPLLPPRGRPQDRPRPFRAAWSLGKQVLNRKARVWLRRVGRQAGLTW